MIATIIWWLVRVLAVTFTAYALFSPIYSIFRDSDRQDPYLYRYKYQRYPFDDPQYFEVRAPNRQEADIAAKDIFSKMFEAKITIMTEFQFVPSRH